MRGGPRRGVFVLAAVLALPGCAAEVDGPGPIVTSVHNESGTNVICMICTCDELAGCIKDRNDVLTISGSGFAQRERPALELPGPTWRRRRTRPPGRWAAW